MLFGIALQRAIELLKDVLSPTLSASIAMESAVAMSKVRLRSPQSPGGLEGGATQPPLVATEMRATAPPVSFAALADSAIIRAPLRERRKTRREEPSAPRIRALVARLPPAARMSAAASLAFVVIVAGAIHRSDPSEARIAVPEVRTLQSLKAMPAFADSTSPPQQTSFGEEPPVPQQMAAAPEAPPPSQEGIAPPPEDDPLPPPQPPSDGTSDIVIPDS
jgi:hypothetical protein